MSLQDQPQDPVAVAAREASALFYLKMGGLLADRDYLAGAMAAYLQSQGRPLPGFLAAMLPASPPRAPVERP